MKNQPINPGDQFRDESGNLVTIVKTWKEGNGNWYETSAGERVIKSTISYRLSKRIWTRVEETNP
jgi:sugar diacid utilization regulator